MKKILLVLVVLVALVVVVGLLLPREMHMERETVIDAPQSTVFALVNSYARFNEWSPWAQIDPEGTTYEFSGPARGEGAAMSWTSDHNQVGSGSQKIVSSTPHSEVLTALDFGDQGTADAFFRLSPADSGGTKVVWGFDSDLGMNPIGRIFGNFFLEGMLGPQYEEGLAGLKTLAESLPKADFSDLEVEIVDVEPQTIAYVSDETPIDPEQIAQAYAEDYGQVMAFLGEHSLEPTGPPLSVNKEWGETFSFDAGMPIASAPESVPEDSPVQVRETYGGTAVKVVHVGSYASMEQTYEKIDAYIAAYGLEKSNYPWDVWISDPGNTPEPELITHIYQPVQ